MRPESWADSYEPASCPSDREDRRTWLLHVDRCHNSVYVAACRSSSRSPPCRMDCCGTAILPLLLAAQEAWMSINRLQLDRGPRAVLTECDRSRLGGGPRRGAF